MGLVAIERGDLVEAITARGDVVRMRALGAPIMGRDFPVLWVCTEEEWSRSQSVDDEADGLPWPFEDIKELSDA
jgi:hypothetical protein